MRIILVGGRNHNQFLIQPILERGHQVTVIHESRDYCRRLARENTATVIHGDGSNPLVLTDAGVEYANVVIAMTEDDAKNFVVCHIAQETYDVDKTLAVVNNPSNIDIFKQLGLENVISITNVISSFIEQKVEIDDVTNIYTISEDKVSSLEIEVDEDAPAIDCPVKELEIKGMANVAMIIRGEQVVIPTDDTKIEIDDRLVVYCHPSVRKKFIKSILGRSK